MFWFGEGKSSHMVTTNMAPIAGFRVFGHITLPARRTCVEENAQKLAHKRARESVIADAMQAELERRTSQVESAERQHAGWKFILSYITNIDTHGTKKPEDMSWDYFFRVACEGDAHAFESLECPPLFDTTVLPYDQCLLAVTKHVTSSACELERAKVSLNKQKQKDVEAKSRKAKQAARERKTLEKAEPDSAKFEAEKNLICQ